MKRDPSPQALAALRRRPGSPGAPGGRPLGVTKLPEPPPKATLERISPPVATLQGGTKLWRIYFRDGSYPTTWERMRYYGPVRSSRFDHHLDPAGLQDRGILYAATGDDAIATCLAEVFQDTRLVDTRRNEPRLAAFALARRSEEHTSALQSRGHLVCRLLLVK